mgnify:CR=1 FL=1
MVAIKPDEISSIIRDKIKNYETKTEHFGVKAGYNPEGVLMIWPCEGEAPGNTPRTSHRILMRIAKKKMPQGCKICCHVGFAGALLYIVQ